jgi:hypothetical protein
MRNVEQESSEKAKKEIKKNVEEKKKQLGFEHN